MPSGIYAQETLNVGTALVLQSASPGAPYAVVFEDDGETGYFYGLKHDPASRPGNADDPNQESPILDALHVYNVENVTDRDKPSEVAIAWSDDGLKAALLINRYPHAVFDFEGRRAYCRTNFPPPDPNFTHSHQWDDRAMELFR